MLISQLGLKGGSLTSWVWTKGMAWSRLYFELILIILLTISSQVCVDDPPFQGKDDKEVIKLDHSGSIKEDGMIKVRFKILKFIFILYSQAMVSDQPSGDEKKDSEQSSFERKVGMLKVIIIIFLDYIYSITMLIDHGCYSTWHW